MKRVGKDGGGAVEVVTWAGIAQIIQSGVWVHAMAKLRYCHSIDRAADEVRHLHINTKDSNDGHRRGATTCPHYSPSVHPRRIESIQMQMNI